MNHMIFLLSCVQTISNYWSTFIRNCVATQDKFDSTELVEVISHCVLLIDQFNSIVSVEVYEPERSNKIESGIEKNHSTIEL